MHIIPTPSLPACFVLYEYNPQEFNEYLWDEYIGFSQALACEANPRDPLPDAATIRDFHLHPHPLWTFHTWMILEKPGGRLAARAVLYHQKQDLSVGSEASQRVNFGCSVRTDCRRKGLGTALLQTAVQRARSLGFASIQGECIQSLGKDFSVAMGGIESSVQTISRLYLEDVDWELMEAWQTEGRQRNPFTRIESVHILPDEWMQRYVDLFNFTNRQAPDYDDPDFEPEVASWEDRRATEELVREKGIDWITLLTVEADGSFSGLTETYHNTHEAFMVEQGLTGVLETCRGRGLGKWLKAEMMLRFRNSNPVVQFIYTGNTHLNAPMLAINRRMGFRPYIERSFLTLALDDFDRLNGNRNLKDYGDVGV